MRQTLRRVPRLTAAMGGILLTGLALAAEPCEPMQIVSNAKAKAVSIPAQAQALTRVAWPDRPLGCPEASSIARAQIVGFGDRGLDALHERLVAAPPRFQADIVSAVIETRLNPGVGRAPQYIPTLYDAVWFGSAEAKRLAMLALADFRYPPATLVMIDAAYEYPVLAPTVIECLARQADDRARYWLSGLLTGENPELSREAARALATIGGRAIQTLRDATVSQDAEVRAAAIDALVPKSGVDDLTILYEYVAQFPDDDPGRIDLVLQRAAQLEAILEARQTVDEDSP